MQSQENKKKSLKFGLRFTVFLLVSTAVFAGCRTTLKSNWANFNAYYNTFYNAKKSYSLGVEKNLGQAREYNPLNPIRIYPEPLNAGTQEFDSAIEKSADILRKHEDTKWVDDALFLIGRSYYFKKDYFSADQKFQELYVTTKNTDLKQKAIFWRGLVLLDMNRFSEGIAYLQNMIQEWEGNWNPDNLAQTRAVLAHHFIEQENWEQAINELLPALKRLPAKEQRERGYFLLGQLFEKVDNTEAAFDAYRQVQNHYYEYRLQYLAKRKQAEVARELGRFDVAGALFNEMIRDDKNLEYRAELDFELAKTEQNRGNVQTAERIFKNLLRNQVNKPSPEISARTYYSLAQIYRYHFDDYTMAAAYYDSAANINVPAERLPNDFAADELAQSFGSYAKIRSDLALQDSLLYLGSLEPAAFDSVITQLRARKIAELQQMREDEENRQNTLVTIDTENEAQDVTSLSNGFLNSNNLLLQQNAKMQFLAIWGDRPLVDNWRVRSLIRDTQKAVEEGNVSGSDAPDAPELNAGFYVEIDISRVPFTPQQKDSVRKLISSYHYQLGNLFFLSLNMPDSAAYYFEKAVDNPSSDNVTMISLYSLSELYAMQGNHQKASEYAKTLINKFPDSEYAQQLRDELNMESSTAVSSVDTLYIYRSILENDSLPANLKAEQLKQFADKFGESKFAAEAQWNAIQIYSELAKAEPGFSSRLKNWIQKHEEWDMKVEAFNAIQDSAEVMLSDTTITTEQREQLLALVDSSLASPVLSDYWPYEGEFWDSTRTATAYFLTNFSGNHHYSKAEKLSKELAIPENAKEAEVEESVDETESTAGLKSDYLNCEQLDEKPLIRGGMNSFLSGIKLPESDLSQIYFRFYINRRGLIDDFILITEDVPDKLKSAFTDAFETLTFEPALVNGEAAAVQCTISFPLKQ